MNAPQRIKWELESPEFLANWERRQDERKFRRTELLKTLGPRVLAVLAVLPLWTEEMLRLSDTMDPSLLDALIDFELATRSVVYTMRPEPAAGTNYERRRSGLICYSVPADVARPVIAAATTFDTAAALLQDLIVAVQRAADNGASIPELVGQFLAVAGDGRSAESVAGRLLELVAVSSTEAESLNLIRSAERLEWLLGRTMSSARLQAGRLIARRERDDRLDESLRTYFRRPELEAPLTSLCRSADPDRWLIHLRGDAGMGKSTLLRWLQRQFPGDGSAGSIVVVDFDYLSPTYPGSEPGLLISRLSADLRLFGSTDVVEQFNQLDKVIASWHTMIDEVERTRPDELPRVRRAQLGRVQEAFAAAVRALPQPVVVVLDTVEELEKAGRTGNLEVTDILLTDLHDAVPSVVAVLSGRRPLRLPTGGREIQVNGFTPDEARRFAGSYGLSHDIAMAVVNRVDGNAGSTGLDLNPFDLALLAGWAATDPTLTADRIAAVDLDTYIEQRLLGRMGEPGESAVRDAIPVIVALRRFDASTLGGALGLGAEDLQDLLSMVARQEWIDQAGRDYEVKAGIRDRLVDYLRRHRRSEWMIASETVGQYLSAWCVTGSRTTIGIDHVSGAIRLSQSNDEQLLDWWLLIEEKARAGRDYSWLLKIAQSLLGSDGPVGAEHRLWPAVEASRLACQERVDPRAVLDVTSWDAVFRAATGRTRWRAAGRLPEHIATALNEWLECAPERPDTERAIAAAFVAGFERILEAPVGVALEPLARLVAEMPTRTGADSGLTGMALALYGRALSATGSVDRSGRRMSQAVSAAGQLAAADGEQFFDWPTTDPGARIRSMVALTRWRIQGDPDRSAAGLPFATAKNQDQLREQSLRHSIDAACGRQLGARVDPRQPSLELPTCWLHRVVPPVVVPVAEVNATAGRLGEALSELQAVREWLLQYTDTTGRGHPDLLAVDRQTAQLARRYRLRDIGIGLTSTLFDTDLLDDRVLLADLEALGAARVNRNYTSKLLMSASTDNAAWHEGWRRVVEGDPELLQIAQSTIHHLPTDPAEMVQSSEARPADVHAALDLVEFHLLNDTPVPKRKFVAASLHWLSKPGRDTDIDLRIAVRCAALTDSPLARQRASEVSNRLGAISAAEIILAEAEALGLRLPARAQPLFDQAAALFGALSPFGQLRAVTGSLLTAAAAGSPSRSADQRQLAFLGRGLFQRLNLPSWKRLHGDPETTMARAPVEWRPWLARFIVAGASGQLSRTALDTIIAYVGVSDSSSSGTALPTDLALALAGTGAQIAAAGPAPGPPSSPGRRDERDLIPTSSLAEDLGGDQMQLVQLTVDSSGIRHSTTGTLSTSDDRVDLAVHSSVNESAARITTRSDDSIRALRAQATRAAVPEQLLSLPIEISHDAEVAGVAWEAALLPNRRYVDLVPHPRIWRRVLGARRADVQNRADLPVVAFGDTYDLSRAMGALHRMSAFSGLKVLEATPCRALLLEGSARQTRAGLRLQTTPTYDGRDPATSLDPADIRSSAPFADLALLAGFTQSGDDNFDLRDQSFALRQLGGELALHGFPAVLVLPSLPYQHISIIGTLLQSLLEVQQLDGVNGSSLLTVTHDVRELTDVDDGAFEIALFLAESLTRVP